MLSRAWNRNATAIKSSLSGRFQLNMTQYRAPYSQPPSRSFSVTRTAPHSLRRVTRSLLLSQNSTIPLLVSPRFGVLTFKRMFSDASKKDAGVKVELDGERIVIPEDDIIKLTWRQKHAPKFVYIAIFLITMATGYCGLNIPEFLIWRLRLPAEYDESGFLPSKITCMQVLLYTAFAEWVKVRILLEDKPGVDAPILDVLKLALHESADIELKRAATALLVMMAEQPEPRNLMIQTQESLFRDLFTLARTKDKDTVLNAMQAIFFCITSGLRLDDILAEDALLFFCSCMRTNDREVMIIGENALALLVLSVPSWEDLKLKQSEKEAVFSAVTMAGGNYAYSGEPDAAIKAYETALKIDPQNPQIRGLLGTELSKAGRLEEANEQLRISLRRDPRQSDAAYSFAKTLLEQSGGDKYHPNVAEAATILTSSIRFNPTSPIVSPTYKLLIRTLDRMGNYNEAMKQAKSWVKAASTDSNAHFTCGRMCVKAGYYEDSIPHLKIACQLDSTMSETHYQLAVAYFRLNKTDEAIAACREAIAQCEFTGTPFPNANLLLGKCFAQKKKWDEAKAAYEELLQLRPRAAHHYELGVVLQKSGDQNAAFGSFAEAMDAWKVAATSSGTATEESERVQSFMKSHPGIKAKVDALGQCCTTPTLEKTPSGHPIRNMCETYKHTFASV